MTKLTTKNLGSLLFELTENVSDEERTTNTKAFVTLLGKKRMIGKVAHIITEYQKIYNAHHGIIEAQITATRRLDTEARSHLHEALKKKYHAKEVQIVEQVDQRLLGGIKVKVGDTVYDASLGNTLKQLHKQLVA